MTKVKDRKNCACYEFYHSNGGVVSTDIAELKRVWTMRCSAVEVDNSECPSRLCFAPNFNVAVPFIDRHFAVLVVDKDIEALATIADRCIIIAKGRIVYEGTPAALAADREALIRHLSV